MGKKAVKTTVTRTVKVEFDQDTVREILRRECGAPPYATVELESYGDAAVTWSTSEDQP
jgi:hypothetical protein